MENNKREGGRGRGVTLGLCVLLHAFSHAYATMLVPLYLMIVADLGLSLVKRASLIVSVYTFAYCAGSYGAGLLADRFDRKWLLGFGLLVNAAAITLIGLSRRYELLLMWAVMAGIGGTLFHPAAGALVPAHFPEAPGMAVGLLGIGSGIGFFVGPQFAGWRAQSAHWSLASVAQWQKPCVELGVAGFVAGLIFLLIAREAPRMGRSERRALHEQSLDPRISRRVLGIGAILGFRDFAGVGGFSLASLYLLRAHHFDARNVGMILGVMMLLSVLVNPTLVWLTPWGKRLPALRMILVLGGIIAICIPYFPAALALPVLCAFQTCQLGSYAISDSALLERCPSHSRGRIYGMYFIVAGTMSAAGPWVMGHWVDAMESRAYRASAYALPFAAVGVAMFLATFATPILGQLGPAIQTVDPLSEIMPTSAEPTG